MPTFSNSIAPADYLILAGFFGLMLVIGFYFAGRMRDLGDYFSGGRRVPWWLAGTSYYMSSFSAFAFVAYSALAYEHGWVAVTLYWVSVPAALVSVALVAARWRRAATTSPVEFLEERYGRFMRQSLAWLGIPVKIIDDGLKLFAIGLLVSTGLGIRHPHALAWGILGSGLIMLLYTLMGGLWAVLVTDFIQFLVMIAAVLVLFPLALSRVGGLGAFVDGSPDGFFRLTSAEFGPGYIVAFLFIMIFSYSTQWQLVQRFYIVPRDADARRVGYLVAALNLVTPPLFFAPAMMARQFLPGVDDPANIYALLCRELLPVGMTGLIVAAMFAATMSMLSSDYNAVAAVLTNDIYRRLIAPAASGRVLVRVGRLTTLIAGLLSLAVAFMIVASEGESGLFDRMVSLFSLFLPPIAIPMLAGLLTRRVSNAGAVLGLAAGILVGLAAYIIRTTLAAPPDADPATFTAAQRLAALLRGNQVMTALTASTALLGLGVGSWLRPDPAAQRARTDAFFTRLTEPEPAAPPPAATGPADFSPLPFIALVTAALGALLLLVVLLFVSLEQGLPSLFVGAGMLLLGLVLWMLDRRKEKNRHALP
ncbi:MAG: Sodium/glucose cotransporter [candidate division BRC1 bacterium ADurb.BinA292]|nr:MAG: Sodium/glucose cotransporter [candidate division BRC1 bacterium ADurb.BinA292]